MRKISTCASILALFLLMNCATNVKSKSFTDTSLSSYKTFAYLPNTDLNAEEFNSSADKTVEESLMESLNAKMMAKGYSLDTSDPDLVVLLTTSNAFKSNTNTTDAEQAKNKVSGNAEGPNTASVSSSQFRRYLSAGSEAIANVPYKNGSLIVELFDTSSKKLLWVGIAEDFKSHISDRTLMTRMVDEIFKKFPN